MPTRREMLGSAALAAAAVPLGHPHGGSAGLIDDLQHRTFRFFWDTTNPANGLARDRWPTPSFASIAATGFALTAYPIGVARGWITRGQAVERTLATLRFFARAPQGDAATGMTGYKGFFYHFLDMETGARFRDAELSTIDSTLLIGGMLFAQSWFDRADPREAEIRALADTIYDRVDWTWITPRAPFVGMGWHPGRGFIASDWDQYNESLLLYVLALGSRTHPLPPAGWDAWTATFAKAWSTGASRPFIQFAPLFGHQYSHVWLDLRGIRDRLMRARDSDYFENSRRATYAQRAYAVANAGRWRGYGADIWGLSACDGPGDFTIPLGGRTREFFSYSARGPGDRDDGTLAPTAAAGSIAFAPEIVVPAITAMHRRYGAAIYARYGFLDAFNPTLTDASAPLQHGRVVPGVGWVGPDHLGIDQGPIVAMIENHRSGLIWQAMRRSPAIRRGLTRAGFTGGWLAA